MANTETINNHAAFIWSVADLLRGDYKQSEYGRVILPFTVLRRLDCVLDPVKGEMLAKYESVKGRVENFGPVLDALTDIDGLWNTSRFDLPKLLNDPDNLADNLRACIHGFSPEAQEILDKFDFPTQITRLDKAQLLYLVVSRFAEIDLHLTPPRSRTSRWATSTRNSSGGSRSCRTRPPASTSPLER